MIDKGGVFVWTLPFFMKHMLENKDLENKDHGKTNRHTNIHQ